MTQTDYAALLDERVKEEFQGYFLKWHGLARHLGQYHKLEHIVRDEETGRLKVIALDKLPSKREFFLLPEIYHILFPTIKQYIEEVRPSTPEEIASVFENPFTTTSLKKSLSADAGEEYGVFSMTIEDALNNMGVENPKISFSGKRSDYKRQVKKIRKDQLSLVYAGDNLESANERFYGFLQRNITERVINGVVVSELCLEFGVD